MTDKIIAQLEAGTAPWRRPWKDSFTPLSMSTNKPYRGINLLLLSGDGTEGANWWGTMKKIGEHGGKVRKGEKASMAVFWKIVRNEDANGDERTFPLMRYYNVFNATQVDWTDGMPDKFRLPTVEHPGNDAAEQVVSSYKGRPTIIHGGGRACYSPTADRVDMPDKAAFLTEDAYWSTLFHELAHSTGHQTRLNRPGVTNPITFGSHTYGCEELVAEIGSAILCAHAGIDNTESNAAYVQSWLTTIREDRSIVVTAATAAQKAADAILGVEWDN